jgi:hypothetical protein
MQKRIRRMVLHALQNYFAAHQTPDQTSSDVDKRTRQSERELARPVTFRTRPLSTADSKFGCFKISIYKIEDSVRTSQEAHYHSTTEPNLLMLFGETVAVYCVRTIRNTQIHCVAKQYLQETHYVSATEPNRLMLCGETVAVYCVRTTRNTQIHRVDIPYLTGNRMHLH